MSILRKISHEMSESGTIEFMLVMTKNNNEFFDSMKRK
ncbi:transcription termination factor Rho [Thalassomonas viridans]|uniref:Transcription termination factor Rho n=1 Tax=Thalassomonas viridans TaxID=137584 RepID=A0AAE9Z966_9GAMM|nr:transcription termination factor Rho [Thalassomonas viridans]